VKLGWSRTLAEEARRRAASLLVMGIGRHNPLDRLFGAETTLATLRESAVPVLAVGMNFPAAPKHAVVGMDFSAASIHATRLAMRLVGDDGRITLVHVRPKFEHPSADWQWDGTTENVAALFEQIRGQLKRETMVRDGHGARRSPPARYVCAAGGRVIAWARNDMG
jgi:nucleotide-binding universal stress UspA family protein